MAEESLDDIPRTSLPNWQGRIGYVVYILVELVMLDLLRKEVIGDMLDSHTANYFKTDIGPDKQSKRLLTSRLFRAQIVTFVRPKTDTDRRI